MAPLAAEALKEAAAQTGQICTTTGEVVDLTGAPFQPSTVKTTEPPKQKSMIGEHSKDLPPLQLQRIFLLPQQTEITQQRQGVLQNQTPEEAAAIRDRQILAQKRQLAIGLTARTLK